MNDYTLIIPDNDCGIPAGDYDWRELVALLREHSGEPETIYFLADMME
jgi:hypothetical protein